MQEAEMKRSAISLALLALVCGSAQAQSSVTLYGIVDASVQWNKQYSSTSAQQESVWSIDSGYQSGSRFGLRGSESLGNGLTAIFTLEGGFDASTGQSTQGGLLFGRQAWAGVQGGWGSVTAGRIPTPSSGTGSFDMFGAVDPFTAGFGINAIGSTFVAANALREDNAVLYVTPLLGGLKAAAGYSFNRGGSETSPQGSNSNAVNLAASFSAGPFYAVVTYDVLGYPDAGSPTANAGLPDEKLLQIGGTFDLKAVKLHAAWADQSKISAARAGVAAAPPSTTTRCGCWVSRRRSPAARCWPRIRARTPTVRSMPQTQARKASNPTTRCGEWHSLTRCRGAPTSIWAMARCRPRGRSVRRRSIGSSRPSA